MATRFGWGSLSARVIGLSALMTLAIITAAFTLTYIAATRIIEQETANVVEAELRGIVEASDGGRNLEALALAIRDRAVGESEAIYLLTDGAGATIAGNLSGWPSNVRTDGQWTAVRGVRAPNGQEVEIGAVAFVAPFGTRLLVGRDLRAERNFQAALIESGAVALLAAVLLAGASGFILNRLVMRRVGDIDETARAIVAGDLSKRIPVRAGGDEFGRLAVTLNGMLERIEALVTELRTVTDSLSHDLRTPLTRLKTQIQRGNDAELSDAARREALGQAADEADRIIQSFGAMIDIARAEAGAARDQFAEVDLRAVVRGVYELHQPLAEDEGVSLSFDEGGDAPVTVQGHAQFLAQLVSNLVDNALKHGADGKAVAMAVRREGSMAEVVVSDTGKGIPEGQREGALKRFGRLDAARTTPGYGLGLSLAATLARMHGGELVLEDNAPGLRVRVRIPVTG